MDYLFILFYLFCFSLFFYTSVDLVFWVPIRVPHDPHLEQRYTRYVHVTEKFEIISFWPIDTLKIIFFCWGRESIFGIIYIKYGIEKLLLNLTSSFLTPCCNVFLNQHESAWPYLKKTLAKLWQRPISDIVEVTWLQVLGEGPTK